MQVWIQSLNLTQNLMTYHSKILTMAKKIISKAQTHTHKSCKYCREIDYEFLNYNGKPITGECVYCKTRFLLNEKTECKYYE